MHARFTWKSGRVTTAALAGIVFSMLVIWAATFLVKTKGKPAASPLMVYCAASLKAPMEVLAKEYERQYHTPVQLQFGASQSLLASIEISKSGDLYLPADDSYFSAAATRKLIGAVLPIARQNGILMVAAGNPKNIKSLPDLMRPDVRLALANPDAAAIGKLVRQSLPKEEWEPLSKKATVQAATVTEAANAVKIGSADAAFIFDSMRQQYAGFDFVFLPETSGVHALVGVGVLSCSHQAEEATKLAKFLASDKDGLPVFKANGFTDR